MKTFVAALLVSSLAFAEPPLKECREATPLEDQAPDVAGVSVKLRAGEPAPFDARALSLEENCERGKAKASCVAELTDAKTFVWVSKPALVTIIVGAAALSAAAAAGVTAWALKK